MKWVLIALAISRAAAAEGTGVIAIGSDRAATMFRLGFSQQQATRRLCARVAWEFDPPSKAGVHKRPDGLSDSAIAKIVADTYARRPGGW